jgi:hypothetical protein
VKDHIALAEEIMQMEIQGGIDMSVNNVMDANAFLMQNWDRPPRPPASQSKSERKKAMEMFGKVLRDCDKAMERVMDDHIENVAKSAKELAEYRKKRAVVERKKDAADRQRMINEEILVSRINQRNMLAELRADDIDRIDPPER